MNFNVYAIKDKKSTYSTDLLILPSDDLAKRYFGNMVTSLRASGENHMILNYPEDFDLYRIGHYDAETGFISSCQPDFICCAANFLKVGE